MNHIRYTLSYVPWIMDEIENAVILNCKSLSQNPPQRYSEWIDHYRKNLYFGVITMKPIYFPIKTHRERGFSAEICKEELLGYYKNLSRKLIGPRWKRKQARQPFAVCCLDAEYSRGYSQKPTDWTKAKNIHINGLFLAHPDTDPLRLAKSWNSAVPTRSRIDSVHAEVFDPQRATVERLAKYVSKAESPQSDQPVQLFILPEGKSRKRREKALNNRAAPVSHLIQLTCPGGAACPLRELTQYQTGDPYEHGDGQRVAATMSGAANTNSQLM